MPRSTTPQTQNDAMLRRSIRQLNDTSERIQSGELIAEAAVTKVARFTIDLSSTGQTTAFTPESGEVYAVNWIEFWVPETGSVSTDPVIRVLRGATEIARNRTLAGFLDQRTMFTIHFDGGSHTITSDYPLSIDVTTPLAPATAQTVTCDVLGRSLA